MTKQSAQWDTKGLLAKAEADENRMLRERSRCMKDFFQFMIAAKAEKLTTPVAVSRFLSERVEDKRAADILCFVSMQIEHDGKINSTGLEGIERIANRDNASATRWEAAQLSGLVVLGDNSASIDVNYLPVFLDYMGFNSPWKDGE